MDSRKVQLLIRVDDTLKTEVTEEEKQFRESKFANENVILKQKVLCTACGKDLKDKITLRYQINIHPVLEVLWCKKCEEFYDDGNFSMDEDGSDKYCRWCAQGGQLYCCSHCSIAFCANCIKRNFKRTKIMKDIEDDEWQCFVCDTEPLWTLRAICDASKRYVESHLNRRKSRRSVKLNESDEDTAETVDSEASSTRTRRGKQNAKQTVANSKSTTESEENVSAEVNKRGKRKRASSGEETPTKSRGKRGKSREDVEPTENADQKRKKSFENFIVEAINDFGTFRKILSKKELSLKKEYLGKDISQLDEIIVKAQEEFSKVCHDAKTSLENIEKKIADQLLTLRKTPEDDKKSDAEPESPSKDPLAPSDEPEEPSNETATDVTQPEHDTQSDKPTIGISDKSPTPSVNGKPEENGNDMSLTIISDEEPPNEKTEEATKSTTSVNDSLAVNISSIIESLKTDDDSRITENLRDRNINDDTTVIDDIEMIDDTAPDDVEMIDDPKETTRDNSQPQKDQVPENSAIASPEIDKSPLIKDKISKMALLQSSSDNASSSDNEGAKVKSSDSDLSGVSVLHSDPDEANTTKRKKRKKRKELDQLGAKLKSKKERAETDEDAEIDRLTNLDSLKKRKKRGASSESGDSENDKSETENVDGEKEKNSVSKKKNSDKENGDGESKDGEESAKKKKKCLSSSEKKKRNSMLDYFSQSDQDSDASNASFSKFSSFIENKHKAFLVGKDELSKKCLLSSSEEEQLENGDKSENDSPKKSSVKKGRPAREAAPKKSMIITTDEEAEEEEKKKKDKKKDKSKWRSDSLLKSKVSETDTSDEERMIERERRRRQKEAEQSKNKNSSDSEDLFRPKKRETSAKKRKAKVASSGSEFDVDKAEESDDSVQIISEDEKPIAKKKKRRRIKKFNDSDSSADENDKESNAPGSASKGRKHIRKILKEEDLAELTKRMAKEEEERKKRIAERQALFNESFQMEKVEGEQLTKLVLDFDSKTKEELISVHPNLVKKLKPHQAKGVKFMWDSCFESVKMARTTPGGGCILAHCMGLGKTLQVITLVHTVMRYPELNVQRVLVICPLSTVLNWKAEFDLWLRDVEDGDDINIFHLKKNSNNVLRADHLNNWFREGGVMILGYEMFRNLINTTKCKKKIKEYFLESLVDPGPDLVICDEGHMLKNEATALSQAAMKIKTKRRIVLTGTPLQNNLKEYHCMVQFVKPNLLGDKKEFLNRFANPITNGQYSDSTSHDVRVMKRRAHVLHKMLDGIVQRFDYNVLTPFLPNKHEFVIMVALSDLQAKLYQYYIDHFSKKVNPQSRLLKDYQTMRLIWTHPLAMKLGEERSRKLEEKKDYDSEGSLKDFVVHSSDESDDSDDDKSDNSVVSIKSDDSRKGQPKRRLTRAKKKELGITDEDLCVLDNDNDDNRPAVWWKSMINEEEMEDYKLGPKLILLFAILKHCENIGDKLLVFSQSIPSLDMIEYFLKNLEETPNKDDKQEESDSFGTWEKGADYFRLDGQTAPELRTMYCNAFNKTSNLRARLFLISTKAGGLGINLTAANRVVIFDASWNPSYDVQSIFRVYRFGQNKPCYIYRFLSQGTMEEKIYERQVTKLSISCRVVDEQQIDRHFNNADVESLYEFNRKKPSQDEIPKLPKDRLMAELLKEYKDIILTYLEHDSLLENIAEEELTEEERKQAWEDYENEKKGKVMNLQNQQFTMTAAQADFMFHKDTIMAALKKEHPNVSDDQLQVMYTMVRDKLKMHYIAQLQAQQQQQLRAAQAAQMANQAAQMAQMANQANKAADPLAQQKHAAYVQNLQLKNQFDQQVKDRLQAATYAAKNAGSTSQK